ncbi:AAA family ATPase [Kocuria sp. CPCC 205300]|uniref:AAA family ATPase n=1 Tax=Kocuria sabuli TaxID=3071448 RepID=UPI0036D9E1FE
MTNLYALPDDGDPRSVAMGPNPYHDGDYDGQGEPVANRSILKLRRLSEIKTPPPTRWIGPGWLPRAELTVLVGDEGIGKSLTWVLMAAHITKGTPCPAFNIPARKPADVVLVVTEDSTGEVEERLKLAGADLERVFIFSAKEDGTEPPTFGNSVRSGAFETLDSYLGDDELNPALVVVDAWLDTVEGNLNIRDTQQARAALNPWKIMATRHDTAVLLVTHTNRADTANTRNLMGGTAALRQKARMVLWAARPPAAEGEDSALPRLVLGPEKSNVTGLADAVVMDVEVAQVRPRSDEDPGTTAYLARPASMCQPIRDLVIQWHEDERQQERQANRKPTKAEEAAAVIREYMTGREEAPTAELKTHLSGKGFGKTAIEDALKAAGTSAPTGRRQPYVFRLHESDVQSIDDVELPGI